MTPWILADTENAFFRNVGNYVRAILYGVTAAANTVLIVGERLIYEGKILS